LLFTKQNQGSIFLKKNFLLHFFPDDFFQFTISLFFLSLHTFILMFGFMPGDFTFTMIKPDAVRDNNTGAILQMINKAGFRIVAMKMTRLSPEKAGDFYVVHKERPFYKELVQYMSNGPIVAAILEKENAVADFRKLIGATDPAKAEEGTIRKLFARSVGENAIHGSDSDENAKIEAAFFFSELEKF